MNPFIVLGPLILLLAVAPYVTPRPQPYSSASTPRALAAPSPVSAAMRREARRAEIWRRTLLEERVDSTVDGENR